MHLHGCGPFNGLGFLGQQKTFHSVRNLGQFFINCFKCILVHRASKAQQLNQRLKRLSHKQNCDSMAFYIISVVGLSHVWDELLLAKIS